MRSCEAVRRGTSFVAALIVALVTTTSGQDSAPSTALTLVSRDARRTIPTSVQNGREVVALDDLATLFQLSVKEDALAFELTPAAPKDPKPRKPKKAARAKAKPAAEE